MRPRLVSVLFLASLLALTAVSSAQAAFPGQNGKIVYRGDCVWTVNPDGSGATSLTGQSSCSPIPLSVSPDGGRIAYSRPPTSGGPNELRLINVDGTNQMLLTQGSSPAWSPDGTRIAFTRPSSPSPGAYSEIWSIDSDGSNLKRIVASYPALPVAYASDLKWSPDGTEIAFDAVQDIWIMKADGSSFRQLTFSDPPCCDFDKAIEPTWSPDGSTIAFKHGYCLSEEFCGGSIELIDRDGTNRQSIPNSDSYDEEMPAWSPDGQKIAYVADNVLRVMNADGNNRANLAILGYGGTDWQPLPGSSPLPSYEAPKFAGTVKAALVPAFRQCGSGGNPVNASHPPPLSTGSCSPPKPGSVANFGPQSLGFAQLAVIYGDTNPSNGDQANVTIRSSLSDVQTAAGADYDPNPAGADATLVTSFRFTDRANGRSGGDPGTATDFDFSVPVVCTATADTAVGTSCEVDTTADAAMAGLIKENKATVLQTFRFRLNDSGANGIRGDSDDEPFAMQGVFLP